MQALQLEQRFKEVKEELNRIQDSDEKADMSGIESFHNWEELLLMTYRELQKLGKNLGVPCNIKRQYLQEVLYHSYHGSQAQVAVIVEKAMRERKMNSKKRDRTTESERRKYNQRKITGPKEKWDSLMASKCITPLRPAKLRGHYRNPREMAFHTLRPNNLTSKGIQTQNFPKIHSNPTKKYSRTQRKRYDHDLVPCDRILRSNIFPICDKLQKKKLIQRSRENFVSSSQDLCLRELLAGPTDYQRNRIIAYKPPLRDFNHEHDYDSPVDFSVKTHGGNKNRPHHANLTVQSLLQYQAIDSYSHSSVFTFGTVTQTENYPQDAPMPLSGNAPALYDRQATTDSLNQNPCTRIERYPYTTDYYGQNSDGPISYGIANFDEEDRKDPGMYAGFNVPAYGSPPYLHKKIRSERRQLCWRDADHRYHDRFADNTAGTEEQNNDCVMQPDHIQDYSSRFAGNGIFEPIPNNRDYNNLVTVTPDSTVNTDVPMMRDDSDASSTPVYEVLAPVKPAVYVNDTYDNYDSGYDVTYSSYGNTLPAISEVFPKYCKTTQTYMRPLFVRINDPPDFTDNNSTQEKTQPSIYDINSNVVSQNSETSQKLPDAPVISLVTPPSPQSMQFLGRLETSPKGSEPDATDLETIASQMNSPWSDMEVGASVTVRAPSPIGSWDEILGIINQEEECTQEVASVQCVCCDWIGPSGALEQHVQETHGDKIQLYETRLTITHSVSLGALLRERRQAALVRWHGRLLALLVTYDDPEWILASVATLSQHTENQPCQATITTYNKLSGEPFAWFGPVPYQADLTSHLKAQVSKLGLLANSADVVIWNGQVVRESDCKSICGDLSLNEIMIDFHVELCC